LLSPFASSLSEADEGRKSVRATLVLGTLRNLTGDHGGPENAFGSIVGRLDPLRFQEPQEMTAIMLSSDSVKQPLIVVVSQDAIAKMVG